MRTITGREHDYLNPRDFDIREIARGLSNMCRYAGQVDKFYSVAQHCTLMVQEAYWLKPHVQLAMLLHDASEAYMCDIPAPLKQLLPDYQHLEDKHNIVIAKEFGLTFPFEEIIHVYDRRMCATERVCLFDAGWNPDTDALPFNINIEPVPPGDAEESFLSHYHYLKGKL